MLGPGDRESFFEVQARDRRASWKLAAACAFGVLLMGCALVLTLAPPVVALVIVLTDFLSLFLPGTPNVFDMLLESTPLPETPLGAWLGPAFILLPGTLLALASWATVWRLTRRFDVGHLLLHEETREPQATSLEEQQLGNVIEEMAIAAGVRPPALRLLDAPGMNAVAIGARADEATIVVTSGLLEGLNREETQAIVAHLIASVANGDLRIAHYILAMYATVGLLERLPFAPVDPGMRDWIRSVVRTARTDEPASEKDAGALTLELYKSPAGDAGGLTAMSGGMGRVRLGRVPTITWLERLPKPLAQGIAAPLFYVTIAQTACRLALLGLLVNPLLAVLWRRRRALADASAVQLCREPTSLARAVSKLSNQNAPRIGDPFLAFLFPAARARGGWGAEGNFGGPNAIFPAASLPDPRRRAARLQRMGAQDPAVRHRRRPVMDTLALVGRGVLVLLNVALWAFCFTASCLTLAAAIFVGAPMAFFLLVLGPHILLRGILPWLLGR